MFISRKSRRTAFSAGAAVALAASLAACGSSGTKSSSATAAPAGAANVGSTDNGSASAFSAQLQTYYNGTSQSPPTSAPTPPKNVDLWILSCGQASAGCAGPVAAAKQAATLLGWSANVYDGNFGQGDAYNTGLRQAIAAHATAIITVGVDCNQAKAGYQAAKSAGIPVVGANSFDCNDPHINGGPSLLTATVQYTPQASSSAQTLEEVGAAKADWIIVHTHEQAKVINLYFQALTGGYYQNVGFVNEIKKCTTCQVIDTIAFAPEATTNGQLKQEFSSALAQYPQANAGLVLSDGIITQDSLAQVVQSLGRSKTFDLLGEEGYAANVQLVRNGDGQAGGVAYNSNWVAWGAVDELIRVLDKQPTVDEGIGVQAWDATHNLPAPGQDFNGSVNFEPLYEKAWGVGS